MKTLKRLLPALFLFAVGCGDDEPNTDTGEEASYLATGITCNGSPATASVVLSFTFGVSGNLLGLGGFTESPQASCSGVYTLTASNFADDGTFTYGIPGAAASCRDTDGETVTSCDVGGIACDTASTDTATTVSGTYTRTAEELVLTTTSTGESLCPNGETEVVTMTAQE